MIHERKLDSRMTKLLLACVIAMMFFVCSGFKAHAMSVKQTGEGDTSITVGWDSPYISSGSVINGFYVGYAEYPEGGNLTTSKANAVAMADQKKIALPGNARSYTINGLKKSERYVVYVAYTYTSKYGSQYSGNTYISSAYTKVQKVTNVRQKKWWYWALDVEAEWDAQPGVKYEVKFMDRKGKVLKYLSASSATSSTSASLPNVKNNKIYKVMVRAFRTRSSYESTLGTSYGAWSDVAYLFTQPMVQSAKVSGGKLRLKWNKVEGMTSYTVYVSTKEKKGYKKVGTVKGNKTSLTVKKLKKKRFKSSKKYYVYIVGNMKINGRTYTSGRHYTNTVQRGSITTNWTF